MDQTTPITLTNKNLDITIIPKANMVISNIKHHGKETLAQREGIQGYIKNLKSFGIPLLAPWANRLATNQYTVENQTVTFNTEGMKLDENGHPNHGTLTATDKWETQHTPTTLTGIYHYNQTTPHYQAYPYPHTITINYTLTENLFTITTTIHNTGQHTLPIAYGYHPYFLTQKENIQLKGDKTLIPLNKHFLPKPSNTLNEQTDAQMFKIEGTWETIIQTPTTQITMEATNYPYLLIWTPENSNFAAIEPMTANIDPFNNNPTLLPAGQKHTTAIKLKF